MSKALELMIAENAAAELEQLTARISDYDREFHSAFQRQMGFAFLAGLALNRAKEICPHGKFVEWRETNLPTVSRSSASRYALFADALLAKDPTVGNLPEARLLGNGEPLSLEEEKKIVEAVHDMADGKTLTEMYRDLGVIRQPKKQEHHPIKQSPEEKLEAEQRADLEFGQRLAAEAREAVVQWRDYQEDGELRLPAVLHWPKKLREEIRGLHIELGKILDGIGKQRKGGGK